MTTKFIKKHAEKAALLSFNKGILDGSTANKFLREFKKLPLNQAIMGIGFYLKALKRQINKHVLTIESASRLAREDEKLIVKVLGNEFRILETQTKLCPSLLGGIKVKIADTVLDLTIKEKLNQIKSALIN